MMTYAEYHQQSSALGDIDPAFDALRYICDRFELNIEQRHWLAFLYATCYSAATAYYIYNEFPDFENVASGRLRRWWSSGKNLCLFQTDRLRMKTQDYFVPCVLSYREIMRSGSQAQAFGLLKQARPEWTYDAAYAFASGIRYFGRFSLFNYLQAIHELTGIDMQPHAFDIREAESCRGGLAYAIGREDLAYDPLTRKDARLLQDSLVATYAAVAPTTARHGTYWSIETTLCAYRKYREGRRYPGYYIDRMGAEIHTMQKNVPYGVCWDVLWQFRSETYAPDQLWENVRTIPPRLLR